MTNVFNNVILSGIVGKVSDAIETHSGDIVRFQIKIDNSFEDRKTGQLIERIRAVRCASRPSEFIYEGAEIIIQGKFCVAGTPEHMFTNIFCTRVYPTEVETIYQEDKETMKSLPPQPPAEA